VETWTVYSWNCRAAFAPRVDWSNGLAGTAARTIYLSTTINYSVKTELLLSKNLTNSSVIAEKRCATARRFISYHESLPSCHVYIVLHNTHRISQFYNLKLTTPTFTINIWNSFKALLQLQNVVWKVIFMNQMPTTYAIWIITFYGPPCIIPGKETSHSVAYLLDTWCAAAVGLIRGISLQRRVDSLGLRSTRLWLS